MSKDNFNLVEETGVKRFKDVILTEENGELILNVLWCKDFITYRTPLFKVTKDKDGDIIFDDLDNRIIIYPTAEFQTRIYPGKITHRMDIDVQSGIELNIYLIDDNNYEETYFGCDIVVDGEASFLCIKNQDGVRISDKINLDATIGA